MHKKACKQFAEDKQTKDMDYWNHVLWSDETKMNLIGSDGVKCVWRQPGEENKDKCVLPTVKHGGGSVMVWGWMSAAGTGELQFIERSMNANMYCDILKQSMIPSLRRLGGQYANIIKTTALLKKLRVKVMDWHVPPGIFEPSGFWMQLPKDKKIIFSAWLNISARHIISC